MTDRGEFTPFFCPREPNADEGHRKATSPGLKLLWKAVLTCEELSLPPRADAVVGALALAIMDIAKTSPFDTAERVKVIGRIMESGG